MRHSLDWFVLSIKTRDGPLCIVALNFSFDLKNGSGLPRIQWSANRGGPRLEIEPAAGVHQRRLRTRFRLRRHQRRRANRWGTAEIARKKSTLSFFFISTRSEIYLAHFFSFSLILPTAIFSSKFYRLKRKHPYIFGWMSCLTLDIFIFDLAELDQGVLYLVCLGTRVLPWIKVNEFCFHWTTKISMLEKIWSWWFQGFYQIRVGSISKKKLLPRRIFTFRLPLPCEKENNII